MNQIVSNTHSEEPLEPSSSFPSDQEIEEVLNHRFEEAEDEATGPLEVLHRRPHKAVSTFPCEVIRCRTKSGEEVEILGKYQVDQGHNDFGHRGGVAYEAQIYRDYLERHPLPTARYYGYLHRHGVEAHCLFIAYLSSALRISKQSLEYPLNDAANWLGEFHRSTAQALTLANPSIPNSYDTIYFQRWVDRTLEFSSELPVQIRRLEKVASAFLAESSILLENLTLIHGEYTTSNILAHQNTIVPVDWESAAMADGVIDLACLIDGHWGNKITRATTQAYLDSRWPEGAPEDFIHRLTVAQMYIHFRWLGDREDWTRHPDVQWRYQSLFDLAAEANLV